MSFDDPLDAVWNWPWRVDPCGVVALERACAEEPRLREVMKWYDAEHRYISCELMICSTPTQAKDLQVFGLFVVDVEGYRKRAPRPIEQDFLVRSTRAKSPTVYYSGQPPDHPLRTSGFWQDISAFCERVGRTGDYGCKQGKSGRWGTTDHWLPADAPLFSSSAEIRAAIDKALEKASVIIEVRAMGAMPPAERPWQKE